MHYLTRFFAIIFMPRSLFGFRCHSNMRCREVRANILSLLLVNQYQIYFQSFIIYFLNWQHKRVVLWYIGILFFSPRPTNFKKTANPHKYWVCDTSDKIFPLDFDHFSACFCIKLSPQPKAEGFYLYYFLLVKQKII